ncbi:MAG TPA: nodulation protein NfeD [Actinomycetota bacterium]|nr:nodulation protein NfeD [Actinomycetota bacterium]
MDRKRSLVRGRRLAIVAVAGMVLGLGAGMLQARADSSASTVMGLQLTGVVDPFIANYISGGIKEANQRGDAAVLITIDTPGGLDSSMREITQAILSSKIPVFCYTSPEGARAASAGTFVMESCPVAAMAPGTNIGAAHPVGVSGAIEIEKVTNDAAAYIRSLAQQWGRNADAAEEAVRKATSWSAQDALNIHLIDVIAPTEGTLLNIAGGCAEPPPSITTGLLAQSGPIAGLCGATINDRRMGFGASLLHSLITPDFAFLFFYAGIILIIVEFLHPGISVPGIVGSLFLIFSFVSLGMLPVRLSGVILLVLSAVCFLVELKHPGFGLPLIGGLVFLIFGALFLFNSAVANASVSLWLIGVIAAALALFFVFVVRGVMAARHMPKDQVPTQSLVGMVGVAINDLMPEGRVRVHHENWTATSEGGNIPAETEIRVLEVKGLRLIVARADEPASLLTRHTGQLEGEKS